MREPVAIVGRGCVLPDALTPGQFWDNISSGRVSLSAAPAHRWRVPAAVQASLVGPERLCRTGVGGRVHGFEEVFDPRGFRQTDATVQELDVSVRWVMHAARDALVESGIEDPGHRGGLVLGNLFMPTEGMVSYAEDVWLSGQSAAVRRAVRSTTTAEPAAADRFSAALAARVAAASLGLGEGAFAIDAACASSIYAIKLACDRLLDGSADLMLAGAVNRPDDMASHLAFTALAALSASGRSRPFQTGADGLIPAEGCAVVALVRLSDALRDDRRVLAVIRGTGLSNDGRAAGMLAPSRSGQVRAMTRAYTSARIAPASVSLLECHATGTLLGDATEARSIAEVFAGARDLPLGSVKSNVGHLVTAAGAAGLLKVVGAMQAGVRPATPSVDDPIDGVRNAPLRLLQAAEPWDGLRRAGVNAFGFGGNNAHLILDAWPEPEPVALPTTGSLRAQAPVHREAHPAGDPTSPRDGDTVAIVAVGARVGGCGNFPELRDHLLGGRRPSTTIDELTVPLANLRTPPADLQVTLGQQLAVLEAAREVAAVLPLPRERTMVLVGMNCDVEVARHATRVRAAGWLTRVEPVDVPAEAVADTFSAPLGATGVLGTMPNLVANRINAVLDLAGPSFTVAADEASGLLALETGLRALRADEADVVLVGAVDLSHEPVHRRAAAALGLTGQAGDAAVVVALKRLSDARRDGDQVVALVGGGVSTDPVPPGQGGSDPVLLVGDDGDGVGDGDGQGGEVQRFDPADVFGVAHAGIGLLRFVCAAVALRHGAIPRVDQEADPSLGIRRAVVSTRRLGGSVTRVELSVDGVVPWVARTPPTLHVFSGQDAAAVVREARTGREADEGPARLVITAHGPAELAERVEAAARWLEGTSVRPRGVAFQPRPLPGSVAFVFTNGSACYPRMGRELLLAFPEVVDGLARRWGPLHDVTGRWHTGGDPRSASADVDAVQRIGGAAVLANAHSDVLRNVLGVEPTAALGYSSGEASSLISLGAWPDPRSMVTDARASQIFSHEVAGEFRAVRRTWDRYGVVDGRWVAYLLVIDPDVLRSALQGVDLVRLMAVTAPGVCVIGGEAAACAELVARLGESRAVALGDEMAVHVPEVLNLRDRWYDLHHRRTVAVPGVRFYSCAGGAPYAASAAAAAEAITRQAVGTADFTTPVQRAWDDGVRIFVELGPRSRCTGWIDRILHDREHVAVAVDRDGVGGLESLYEVTAELLAAGVRPDHERLTRSLHRAVTAGGEHDDPSPAVRVRAHPRPVEVPRLKPTVQFMAPAPALPPVHPAPRPAPDPSGRGFTRSELEIHASGRISEVFGKEFAVQDGFRRQVRMPMPPLLMTDRVTGIDAEPGRLGTGTIRTETDVTAGAWYLDHTGRMPIGLVMEAGQADLLLISWMGIDLVNGGERAYRLLGSHLTFHGSPPVAGERLSFEIGIDRHDTLGDLRLFSFHYDCWVDGRLTLSVRDAQAGFFTDAELAASKGVLWDAASQPRPTGPHDAPVVLATGTAFDAAQVTACAEGRPVDCFGEEWASTRNHVRTPRIGEGRLQLLEEVETYAPEGGPWGRGYLRARKRVSPEDWFYAGHFKDDPCMPGTLMFEGCLQAMAFHLLASGCTLEADGSRFEPAPGRAAHMRCRRQVTPQSREIVYEVFVSSLATGPVPTLLADVLVTVDGVKAFHVHDAELRLVPDGEAS